MFLLRVANYLHNGKQKAAVAGTLELAKCGSQIHGSACNTLDAICIQLIFEWSMSLSNLLLLWKSGI